MRANQATYSIKTLCRVLGVSRSGFYASQSRAPSTRTRHDAVLTESIRAIHAHSDSTYGAPRIHAEFQEEGTAIARKRVARLMQAAGLAGLSRRRGPVTTVHRPQAVYGPDLVHRRFEADQPDALWVADITYVPSSAGFVYLAVALDAFSRKVVGWSMRHDLQTELVLSALDMALSQRRPESVIHHSDHGCQYTSFAFGQRCRGAGVRPSLGSVGDCYDNALCESFFATLECELLDRRRFATKTEARMAIFRFIEGWYNPHRRHSALAYRSPIKHEQHYLATRALSSP